MCRFCSKTKLNKPCPMCGAAPDLIPPPPPGVQAKIAEAAAENATRKAQRRDPNRPATQAETVAAIRAIWKRGECNVAAALIVGMVKAMDSSWSRWAHTRLDALQHIDERSARQGWISKADEMERTATIDIAITRLGYDPRTEDGPPQPAATDPIAEVVQLRPALEAGETGPLQAGDWGGLWKRVRAGQISEAEAVAFGQIWSAR